MKLFSKIFGFRKNRKDDFALVIAERENFLSILITLARRLKNSEHNGQSEFIYKLIELIDQNNFGHFVTSINGVDMWGGAGAVWEVYIESKNEMKAFEKEILRLIYLMERTKIARRGISPIKRLFENNR